MMDMLLKAGGVVVVALAARSGALMTVMRKVVINPMMSVMFALMPSSAPGGLRSPRLAKLMQPIMRYMMDDSMHVTVHYNDPTYKEVQDFMVPSSVGKPFKDAPGTFDKTMEPRVNDIGFFQMMEMKRIGMVKAGPPHNRGITWEKFCEHRGYAVPGYVPKHPKEGDIVPDGEIFSVDGSMTESTLLTEARKVAKAAGSDKVIICFDAITCPFYRAYCAEDLYSVSNGVPSLHVYIREAEPEDVFDAGGMHCATPLEMKRYIRWHRNAEERAMAANDTKTHLESFMGKGKVTMWMDAMDDKLEALYEARPWRQYVIYAESGKLIACTGLAPFNMKGKLEKIKTACQ